MIWIIFFAAILIVWICIMKKISNNEILDNTNSNPEPEFKPLNLTHTPPQNKVASKNSNPKWQRTQKEKDLKLSFYLKNKQQIQKLESLMIVNEDGKTVDSIINAYRVALNSFYELKDFCYTSTSGKLYFQDNWEYCHNSKIDCFSFDLNLKDKLSHFEANEHSLKFIEQSKTTLRKELLEYLQTHENILQKDIYLDFDPILKSSIQSELYYMDKDGIIIRTKKGNSYIVNISK